MQSTLSLGRSLFPGGYTAEYRARLAAAPGMISRLCDRVLQTLINTKDSTIRDKKGVERALIDELAPGPPISTQNQELLCFSAEIPALERDDETVPFQFSIGTEFKEFVGRSHIDHRLIIERSDPLLADVPPLLLARALPVKPKMLRFGMDLYERGRFAGFLGLTPAVTQTYLVSADANEVSLSVRAEGLKEKNRLPAAEVFELLQLALGVDFKGDYLSKA